MGEQRQAGLDDRWIVGAALGLWALVWLERSALIVIESDPDKAADVAVGAICDAVSVLVSLTMARVLALRRVKQSRPPYLLAAGMIVAGSLLCGALSASLYAAVGLLTPVQQPYSFWFNAIRIAELDLWVYLIWCSTCLFLYSQQGVALQTRQMGDLRDAELLAQNRALTYQLNPERLFGSLDRLGDLLDAAEYRSAERLVIELSDAMRRSIGEPGDAGAKSAP